VYRVGRDRAAAASAARTQSEVTRQMRNLQDGVSGVSLDEEAADLMRFQRAYEANARFFTTVNDTLTTLLNMVGA
jgi:flagellar hook-associated protein 1 FlgK